MNKQRGFTIVELMISLAILSVILLLSTLTLSQLGRLFSKGVSQAATQNAARNLINSVSSDLQFGSNEPTFVSAGSSRSLCLGSTRYTYIPNTPLDDAHPHVMWRDTMSTSSTCTAYDLASYSNPNSAPSAVNNSGSEVLGENMRITDFSARKITERTWEVKVTVAYGDSEAIVYDSAATTEATTRCVSDNPTQFCGVAAFTKSVTRRISE